MLAPPAPPRRIAEGKISAMARPGRDASAAAITELLRGWGEGDERASAELLETVYATLRKLAGAQLRGERAGHTLEPTALVHEAYLRLLGQRELPWRDRAHFFGLAAVTMRRVLVDYARRRLAVKRDGGERLSITVATEPAGSAGGADASGVGDVGLLDLDRALDRFAAEFPRPARVVEMRYFAGLSELEIAAALGLTDRTVRRDWQKARLLLHSMLEA